MQIQQVQKNTIEQTGVKVSTTNTTPQTAVEVSTASKIGEAGFFVPSSEAEQEKQSRDSLSHKAKSIAESQTANHAEYVAGVMNGSLVEKAQEEGVDLSKEEEENLVTVVDKIQMELIQGGNSDIARIADLSVEDLKSVSPTVASAYEMAQKLTTPTREEICYLVGNGLEPSIGNFYQAQTVVSGMEEIGQRKDVPLYEGLFDQVKQRLQELSIEVSEESVQRSVTMVQNGVDLTRENYEYVVQLEQVNLPPQEEELTTSMEDAVKFGRSAVSGMLLPGYSWQERALRAEETIKNATAEDLETLIQEEKEITIAGLQEVIAGRMEGNGESDTYDRGEQEAVAPGNVDDRTKDAETQYRLVSARRALEQVRLYMSAQVNLSLLKRGIHIETESLEELVEELKSQEEVLQKALYGSSASVEGSTGEQQFTDTTRALQDIKQAPAYVLGFVSMNETLSQTARMAEQAAKNSSSGAEYEKANGSYETMMTTVRPDLGDTIQKAFRNVDDILVDLGLSTSTQNQRAVRILAYNQAELTVENIMEMKQKDEQVQNLFHAMTPKVVLSMIREGYNPLDHSLEELGEKAQEIRSTLDDKDTERYSKFLVQLEQQGEISAQERDSFVGIYRLLRQVEKSDGAAVGAAVLAGEKLTLRNLMTQVRNRKSGGVDFTADDSTGERAEAFTADLSITQQIEAAYETSCVKNALYEITPGKLAAASQQSRDGADLLDLTPEQFLEAMRQESKEEEAAYQQQLVKENQQLIRDAYTTVSNNRELEEFFRQTDVPKSAENIQAVADYLKDRNKLYKSLYARQADHADLMQEVAERKQKIWENFSEAVKSPEEMAEAQRTLAETAEQVMEGMLEEEDVSSLDIRQMQMESRQLGILSQLGKKEEYAVPILVADEMGCVSLKIVRGKEEKGKVCITTQTETLGKVAAEFSVTDKGIRGYVVTDSENSRKKLEETGKVLGSAFLEELSEAGAERSGEPSIAFVTSKTLSLEQFYRGSGTGEKEGSQVQTKTLYSVARVFLNTLAEAGKGKEA